MKILGMEVFTSEAMPKDQALLVVPRFTPDGKLDIEETRKASVLLHVGKDRSWA